MRAPPAPAERHREQGEQEPAGVVRAEGEGEQHRGGGTPEQQRLGQEREPGRPQRRPGREREGEHDHRRAEDRHVHEEDPRPSGELGDQRADRRPGDAAGSTERRDDRHGAHPALRRDGLVGERRADGEQARAEGALRDPGRDQGAERRRERGADAEHGEPADEQQHRGAPADGVEPPAARQRECRDRQQVGDRHPLHRRGRHVEGGREVGQHHVDRAEVEAADRDADGSRRDDPGACPGAADRAVQEAGGTAMRCHSGLCSKTYR